MKKYRKYNEIFNLFVRTVIYFVNFIREAKINLFIKGFLAFFLIRWFYKEIKRRKKKKKLRD